MKNKQKNSSSIFETQPSISLTPLNKTQLAFKQYTNQISTRISGAINDQDKSIKRKRLQLQKQLEELRQKYQTQRKKIRQMQELFVLRCQSVIKKDINKWQQNQKFFEDLCRQYQTQIQTQDTINQTNRLKIKLLKQQVQESMRQGIKSKVQERLQSRSLEKSKNIRSKRSLTVKSNSQLTNLKTQISQARLKTQMTEITKPTQGNQILFKFHPPSLSVKKSRKMLTEADQQHQLPIISQNSIRLKTQLSLPALKKSQFLTQQQIQNNDLNFMKPIGTVKKSKRQISVLPEIIKMFKEYFKEIQSKEWQFDWFDKVIFGKRNFSKILANLQNQIKETEQRNQLSSPKKVKDLVAKNLFRLKTQSNALKSENKINLKDKHMINLHRLGNSQKLIK